MEIIGYIFAALAILAFCYGPHTSYITWGGVKGQIPILLYPLHPAVCLMVDAGILSKRVAWIKALPNWSLLVFPVMMVANGCLLVIVGKWSQRCYAALEKQP